MCGNALLRTPFALPDPDADEEPDGEDIIGIVNRGRGRSKRGKSN